MTFNFDTSLISPEELESIISKLQSILEQRKKEVKRRPLTADERIARLRRKDAKNPVMVRIFDEDNEKSCLVPYVQNGQYKLVRAADLRSTISRKGIARWFGGVREGEQAWIEPMIHSMDGDVLVCGSDAFKLLDDDYEHPRFVV